MELANCTVALGGDRGQLVPKYHVTPSEVAVLRFIHGEDAVMDIEVVATVARTGAAERARLHQQYGRYDGNGYQAKAVDVLFPGVAARLFESFDELPNTRSEDADVPINETIVPVEEIVPLEKPKTVRAGRKKAEAPKPSDATAETSEDLLS